MGKGIATSGKFVARPGFKRKPYKCGGGSLSRARDRYESARMVLKESSRRGGSGLKGTTTSGQLVAARSGFKRELRFVLKSLSEICGGESLGRTRASSRNLNVGSTTRMVGKESSRGLSVLKGGIKKNRFSVSNQVNMKRGFVMTTIMSDIPKDLIPEIISRVPMTSLGSIRSTCKNWNALSRNQIFGKVAEAKNLFFGFVLIDTTMYSLRIDHQEIRYDVDDLSFKQASVLNQVNQLQVHEAYQCDGLLLFSFYTDSSRLLVWNPYLGQTRWIQYEQKRFNSYALALGYDNNRNHKIVEISEFGYSIYELSSNSWKVFDVTRNWELPKYKRSVNLKGNTFFFAVEEEECFLLSFDFTLESFGSRLSLPFHCHDDGGTLTLSCVGDEKLAVLVQNLHDLNRRKRMEIWITNKIDGNEVVWTKWMQVEFGRSPSYYGICRPYCESFLIDEEKRLAVVFNLDGCDKERLYRVDRDKGYLYGKSGMFGEDGYCHLYSFGHLRIPKLLSYVPSLVQIE